MRSNYRRIGDFIELVDERNKDLEIDRLLGLSITKEFIPSVANTVGTNMKNYKIIRKNQFACSIMQVRRDKKIPVAILKNYDEAIISQAYPVFRVVDETKLLPDYLMMWMSREEFDREACFLAVGGVRGSLEWEDFLDMELPVPSIEKQREIVAEYNAVVNRIELNEQTNQKLEETAKAIYRQWFEEFEFPISKEFAESIGKPELEGKPYKSSGGEMVYSEELDGEIPKGWEAIKLEDLVRCNYDNYGKDDDFDEIKYLDTGNITENKIDSIRTLNVLEDSLPSRAKRKVTHNDVIYSTVRPNLKHYGLIKNPPKNMLVSTAFAVIQSLSELLSGELIYLHVTNQENTKNLHSRAEMSVSTYPSIKPDDILEIRFPYPNPAHESMLTQAKRLFEPLFDIQLENNIESGYLIELLSILRQRLAKTKSKIKALSV